MSRSSRRKQIAIIAGLAAVLVLAGCMGGGGNGGAPDGDTGGDGAPDDTPDDGQDMNGGMEAEPTSLPGTWTGYKWLDEDIRNAGGLKHRNASVEGAEYKFVPKEMNDSTMPGGRRGELIRYGRSLMANTSEEMPQYVGNNLSCANCHGGGDLPTTTGMVGQDINLIPFVGTSAGYPEWTGRTYRMRNMRLRITGCFLRSMDGGPNSPAGELPALKSKEIQAMESYMIWLGKGTPAETEPYWRHLKKQEAEERKPVQNTNPVRGAKLYLEHCSRCHGNDGQGLLGGSQYPPIWGSGSYSDGAGMSRLYTSTAFIREAMPYDSPHDLTNWSDAQDVAGFVNAHNRPHLDRHPADWPTSTPMNDSSGIRNEALYYDRLQHKLGYDINPMTKKLLVAGIPVGSDQPINESMLEDLNVSRYDQPLRDEDVSDEYPDWLNESQVPDSNVSAWIDHNPPRPDQTWWEEMGISLETIQEEGTQAAIEQAQNGSAS
ncbi:c-type cytochrome [Halorutilales archaeon Cl-col2-1]